MARKIAVGIVGTSWWTELMYLPSLASHPDVRIAAICGRRREPAEELAAKWQIPAVEDDHHSLVARDDLEGRDGGPPDDTHHAITLAALERGLHVLCEKPLACCAADAREMHRRAEARGAKHMVLFTWRFLPHHRYVRQLVDQGAVGRPHQATLHFVADYALPSSYQWRFDARRANGVLGDLGSHLVDLFRFLVGEVASVSAASPSGDRDARLGVTLHGDAGVLEFELLFNGSEKGVIVKAAGRGKQVFEALEVPDLLLGGFEPHDLFGPFSRHSVGPRFFIDAIRDDLPIPMSFEAGWRAQAVIDAALRSDRERRWVEVDYGEVRAR